MQISLGMAGDEKQTTEAGEALTPKRKGTYF
jgi:hypothetical protein